MMKSGFQNPASGSGRWFDGCIGIAGGRFFGHVVKRYRTVGWYRNLRRHRLGEMIQSFHDAKGRWGTSTKRARMAPTICSGGKPIRVSHVMVANCAGTDGVRFDERLVAAARRLTEAFVSVLMAQK